MPRRGLDTRQVVDAAIAIADRDGLEGVTLARVAASLGIRAPSLYHHITRHDGLMRAIALRGLHELTASLQTAARGRAGTEALSATAHAFRNYAHAHPGAYAATLRAAAAGDAVHEVAGREAVQVLSAVLRAWHLEDEEMLHAVRVIRSALHGLVSLDAAGGFALPLDRDRSFERLIETLAAGLPATGVSERDGLQPGDREPEDPGDTGTGLSG